MIQTTFAGGVNPFLSAPPAPLPDGIEPITKKHSLYAWLQTHPLSTRTEISKATGRSRSNVKRITDVMIERGMLTCETRRCSGAMTHFVKVADAVH